MLLKDWKFFLRDYEEWTKTLPEEIIDTKYYDLKNMYVNGDYLVFADFWGCDLRNSKWENIKSLSGNVSLVESNLEGSEFKNCFLNDWDFRGSNLNNVTFEGVTFKWCIIKTKKHENLVFKNCEFHNCTIGEELQKNIS